MEGAACDKAQRKGKIEKAGGQNGARGPNVVREGDQLEEEVQGVSRGWWGTVPLAIEGDQHL